MPLPDRRPAPLRISHRGAHDTLPENTVAAFEDALAQGAQAVELDVHATSDGVVVVHHDPVLHAGGVPRGDAIRIAAIPFDELRAHPVAPGFPIPTLTETLDAIGTRATVFIEIKAKDIEPHVVRCVREARSESAVHSFDHRVIRTVKKIFPAIRCGVLQVARHLDPVASLRETGAEDLWQQVDYIDEELVAEAHSIGARVIAWTANDSTHWPFLRAIGVDGICTDRIGDLAAAAR